MDHVEPEHLGIDFPFGQGVPKAFGIGEGIEERTDGGGFAVAGTGADADGSALPCGGEACEEVRALDMGRAPSRREEFGPDDGVGAVHGFPLNCTPGEPILAVANSHADRVT